MAAKSYDGIGGAGATMLMVILASNPTTAFLAVGFWGKVIHWTATKFFGWMAGQGVMFANVGIAKVDTIIAKSEFESAFSEAFKIIEQRKGALSAAEARKIDDNVIRALRKFGAY